MEKDMFTHGAENSPVQNTQYEAFSYTPHSNTRGEPTAATDTTVSQPVKGKERAQSISYEEIKKRRTLSMDDFADVYTPTTIAFDKQELEKKQERNTTGPEKDARVDHQASESDIQKLSPEEIAKNQEKNLETKRLATALEDMIVLLDSSSQWIPGGRIFKATPYDDEFKGTDLFLEVVLKNGRPITIAIDVTMGIGQIKTKVDKIITPGSHMYNPVTARYYPAKKYELEHPEEKKTAIVKLILGTSREIITDSMQTIGQDVVRLRKTIAEKQHHPSVSKLKDELEVFCHMNPIKKAFLLGGYEQSKLFTEHAEKIGDTATARVYDTVRKIFESAILAHEKKYRSYGKKEVRDPILDAVSKPILVA